MKRKLLTLLCATLIFTTTPVTTYAADFYDTVESLTNSKYTQIHDTFLEYLTGDGSHSCGFNAEDKITDFVLVFEAADPTLLRLSVTFDYMWGDRMIVEESDWDFDVSTGKYVAKAHFGKLDCVGTDCAIGSDVPVDLYITPYVKYKNKPKKSVSKTDVIAKNLIEGNPIPSVIPKIDSSTHTITCNNDGYMSMRYAVKFKAPVSGKYTIHIKDLKSIEMPVEVCVSKLVKNERQSIADAMDYGFNYNNYSSHWLCPQGYDTSDKEMDMEIEPEYELVVTLKKGDIYLIETDTGVDNSFTKYNYAVSIDGPAFLSKESATIKAGKTLNLTLYNTSDTVKWYTSNKKVATVNGGKVKGKKKGTCVITAKCNDKTYKCKIKVK